MIEFADRRDHGYSKGHTLKVALSHALVHRPKNLLLNAPTGGLHIAGKRVVRQLIRDVRDDGNFVLFCSLNLLKWTLAEQIMVIANGELLRGAFTLAERFGLLSLILPPTQKVRRKV